MKAPIPAITLAALCLNACAPWSKQTRTVPYKGQAIDPATSCRFESMPESGRKYGVSVVEFDGKGSYIGGYGQMKDALATLRRKSREGKVLLVIYCHGWNNSSQSGNVVMFTQMLRRLADTQQVKKEGYAVHGVYLGWRGSPFLAAPTPEQVRIEKQIAADFGAERLTDPSMQAPGFLRLPLGLLRPFTYWNIKNRAENHVASVSLASAVFKLAHSVGNRAASGKDRVFVVGHSFGCLVLDRSMNLASVGLISADGAATVGTKRWPFDLIVHLNSASPSLYAKQMADFLYEDARTSAEPRFISVVSESDQATGFWHVVGNYPNKFPGVAPDLQREYLPDGSRKVRAWEYYAHTPANNPYLVNRQLVAAPLPGHFAGIAVPAPGSAEHDELASRVFNYNVTRQVASEPLLTMGNDRKLAAWTIATKEGRGLAFQSNYWFMRVPDSIISGHNGVFSDASQQLVAGLFRNNRILAKAKPPQTAQRDTNDRD